MDSVEVHRFFAERELTVLILEPAMESKLPSISGNTTLTANSSSIIGLPWIVWSSFDVVVGKDSMDSLVLGESPLELSLPKQLAHQL